MTGPDTGGYERGTGAPSRSTGTQGALGAILIVLALGLALRLILAYLLPGSGFEADLTSFRFWASNLASEGLHGFYERDFFHDYTPGYLYVLWVVGTIGRALGGIGDLIKIPPILADLALGYLVWSMIRELGGRPRLALLGGAVVMANPVFWFDNVVWGQVDSVGVVFLLLGLRSLWRDQPERAAIFTVIAAVVKPQLGILVPLVAVVTIRRALWPPQMGDDERSGGPAASVLGRLRAWERRTDRPVRILTTGIAGYVTALALCIPFGLSVIELSGQAPFVTSGLIDQIVFAGSGYPYLTVNAYNAWAVVPGDLGISLANGGLWVCDAAAIPIERCGAGVAQFGAVPAVAVGAGLLVVAIASALWVAARRPDRLTLLVVLAVLALAFFALPTRVHERYGFPFFALGAILLAVSPRWRLAYVVLSIATFANMYVVLTTLYPPTDPAVSPVRDWLGIGELVRSEIGVTLVAALHTGAFAWAWLQLRASAAERLDDERSTATAPVFVSVLTTGDALGGGAVGVGFGREGRPAVTAAAAEARASGGLAAEARAPAPLAAATPTGASPSVGRPGGSPLPRITMPTWSERLPFEAVGWWGWIRDRLRDRPIRADRSRLLVGERGARLDRLDVWILAVVILATFGLRTFRLAEPYQMHFDEVYHARTATEFLQGWRYGESHDIYEWTHPHLAKYLMAAGIVAWGNDRVVATSRLDAPVRAAVVEPRRTDPSTDAPAGERVHVATVDEIRTEDLRTRATVARTPAPGVGALAIDPTVDQLIVGRGDGTLATIDLASIEADAGGADGAVAAELVPLASVEHPVEHLLVSDDGATLIAASGDALTAIDLATAEVLGSAELAGIADLAPAGSGSALVGTPATIDDPAGLAATLVELIGGDAADYELRIAETAPEATVILGAPGSGDTRTAVQGAIDDGRLAGVEIVDLPRVAVATADGVTFIDPSTAGVTSEIAMEGGAHGMALVTELEDSKLYVSEGTESDPGYTIVEVGGDAAQSAPVDRGRHPLPGPGTRVAYDRATQQVHVLGRVPGASGAGSEAWTVYVIEPHANAVYADARLPDDMVPAAWAVDVDAQSVADDREQLLVFGVDGQVAAIDIGSNPFAWRMPGVIAGVIMAACLYLLARILFARRLVALLVGAFVLLDGMLFVQSRIGMNDVYVGAFIIAAYTVFAAVWTGWWRGRGAFWIAMPIVGLLLGLGLASKWVAAYAIGALVLLLLVRSALGRVLAILGLIAITSVLGYLAIAVPAGQGAGNVPFLAIMIALTLVAVVTAVFHPIAWTTEETWLGFVAPAVAGVALFLGALALGRLDATVVIGPLAVTPVHGAIALTLGSLVVYGTYRVGAWFGYGPLAPPRTVDDPGRVLEPAASPPRGWLRPGWLAGLPIAWVALCLVGLPLVVYVASYLPWAAIENHQLWDGTPVGHTGQTLVELTRQMYDYHNGLTSPHPASSPWWAWPFDLKPVWFYQESLASGTSAAIYDAGNLVIWWLGVPAMIFAAVMAFRRRSPALALLAIGFASQWVSWARIDRAAFQYHYYTALPFVILALAYFVAELWHGASRRTWLAARVAAAVAIVAPAAMWLLSRPLCAFVGVQVANPGSQACPAVIPDLVLTLRTAALLAVVGIGTLVLWRGLRALEDTAEAGAFDGGRPAASIRPAVLGALIVAIAMASASLLPETAIVTLRGIPVEPIALIVALPLAWFASQVVAARDAHRFVVGLGVAIVAWFLVWYPNIAALPMPSTVVNAHQGFLPTYLYAFQFPVNTVARAPTALFTPMLALLAAAIAATALVVAYSASVWRLALAGSSTSGADTGDGAAAGEGSDGLARSGGGA